MSARILPLSKRFSPGRIVCAVIAASFACLPAGALNVTGYVIDKTFSPIASAKVCVLSETDRCVTTDVYGSFQITSSLGVRATAPESAPYSLSLHGRSLSLTAPAAVKARLEWIGPDGRSLIKARNVDLGAGRNAISLPAGLPTHGICFIRLETPGLSLSWKAVMMGSQSSATAHAAATGRIASLSKTAAAGTLQVSKLGYRTRIYEPAQDPDTGAVVVLSTNDDVGVTFTGTFQSKVLSIDRTQKKMLVQTISPYCDTNGAIAHDTTVDTNGYALVDGKLWLWIEGDCYGQTFTGTGTDLVGTWTLFDANGELPPPLNAGCIADTSYGGSTYENYTASYHIGDTLLTGNVSLDFCPADLFSSDLFNLFYADTAVVPSTNTCKQFILTNGNNETGTFNYSKKGDSLHAEFLYKTKTCTYDEDFSLGDTDPSCTDTAGVSPFYACVVTSGFSPLSAAAPKVSALTPTPKVAALPMSRERKATGLPGMTWAFPRASGTAQPFPLLPISKVTNGSPAVSGPPVGLRNASSGRGSIFPFHGWRPK